MSLTRAALGLFVVLAAVQPAAGQEVTPPYPRSAVITGVSFDSKTLRWLSPDGRSFVVVFTRNDHWATVAGRFDVAPRGRRP